MYDMGTRMLRLSLIRCDEGMMRILMTCEVGGVGGVYLDDALVSVLKEEVKRYVCVCYWILLLVEVT